MSIETWAQILRSGITFTLLLSVYFAVSVFFSHRRAYKLAPRVNGVLPSYTATMAIGMLVLEITLAWAVIENLLGEGPVETPSRLSDAVVPRLIGFSIGSLLILAGLMTLRKTERTRIAVAKEAAEIMQEMDDREK